MKKLVSAAVAVVMLLGGAVAHADPKNPKIGFSIDDLRVERWTRDRDYFTAAAEQLGAKVYVQSADASEQRQISQIENLPGGLTFWVFNNPHQSINTIINVRK